MMTALPEMLLRGKIAQTDAIAIGCCDGQLTFKKKPPLSKEGARQKQPMLAGTTPAPPESEPATELAAREDWTARLTL